MGIETLNEILIRQAKPSDIPNVRKIELETFHPAETFSYGFLHLMTTYSRPFLVAANTQGELLGYLLGIPQEAFVHIISVAVKPDFQGKGIGTKLLATFIEQMQKEHHHCYRLELRKSNIRARRLYSRFNFQPIGTRQNYYFDGEDAIIMQLRL